MYPRISVIIVNYNTAELLADCLASLLKQESLIHEIVIVDNASADQSVAMVQRNFSSVNLIVGRENIGFGRANNLAFDSCSGDLLFLLNPDASILPGCMEAIRHYMVQNQQIGLAGTSTCNADYTHHSTVDYVYPGEHYSKGLFSDLPGEIAWLLGAGLVIRREVMERVKGFDPDYFLYGEDIDLCLRIRKAGWPLGYISDAKIIHLEGQSERDTDPAVLFEKKMRGELLFCSKHYPPEIVSKIRRVRWLEAWWRIGTLQLSRIFGRESESSRMKRIKYAVASHVYRQR
jgi:GT2 family glycosyltransferase